jgi:hypothetical protein
MEGKGESWPARDAEEKTRATAREIMARHGEQAPEYVSARIEACRIAGQTEDAEAWQHVLRVLSETREEAPASSPAMVPPNIL